MSRIVVATIGSLGDLHPKIAIALELRKRGHDVVFVTHQVYQSKFEALGFEFHQMRPDFTAMNDPQEMARMMDLKLLENPNYATKAAEIGRIIQAENGVGVACDAIEKQLQAASIFP